MEKKKRAAGDYSMVERCCGGGSSSFRPLRGLGFLGRELIGVWLLLVWYCKYYYNTNYRTVR